MSQNVISVALVAKDLAQVTASRVLMALSLKNAPAQVSLFFREELEWQ